MQHTLKLNPEPYSMIFFKRKILEGRLNDEKRQKIKIGDRILFQKQPDLKESFTVEVINLFKYESFKEMSKHTNLYDLGFEKNATSKDVVDCYRKFYSVEDEKKYGVLIIQVEKKA